MNFCTYYDDKLQSAKAQKYCDSRRHVAQQHPLPQHNNALLVRSRSHPHGNRIRRDQVRKRMLSTCKSRVGRPRQLRHRHRRNLTSKACNLFTWIGMFQIPRQVCQLQRNVAGVGPGRAARGGRRGVASRSQRTEEGAL